ncbi:uncharacterized protein HMPREF1541_03317 [Cyphellophora europaea CBS 101466]|uniref:RNA polymerase II-associated protein 1 N-terminal domain-containing protein n=1 Tax=Cyphellophora europaea (strain CBS 101466) TaxID=1220924 RepID=W2RY80_CYPE1|nr:uncharacterized protein HMPREF1541_03317 [Cyphellophora europaea CBS 101466]ETN41382.1 hypothetical protein HMPREF1541_03317 [Cyphellophora europaea CBS 101466]
MAISGQRFELDLDAEDFTINPIDESSLSEAFRIKDIQEHEPADVPAPPQPKATSTGFPEHKQRKVSRFKQKQEQVRHNGIEQLKSRGPSDAALAHRLSRKQGVGAEADQKTEISEENDRRIAAMSTQEIEEARAEIMGTLSPALIQRLMKRSRIDDDEMQNDINLPTPGQNVPSHPSTEVTEPPIRKDVKTAAELLSSSGAQDVQPPADIGADDPDPPPTTIHPEPSNVHFPVPPRSPSDFRPLDPNSPTFLSDLKSTYFPELSHAPSPNALEWLQSPSPQDLEASSYSPALTSYPASSIRFSFRGSLIPPATSLRLPTSLGLHHHGDAPDSAGYTIPELTLLSRSSLPNQRCVAYRTLGRILYRLGKEEFGRRGSELYEALWAEFEKERTLELVMTEAAKERGHVSAKAYATEALWLWRKGCGGERGLRKPGERMAI